MAQWLRTFAVRRANDGLIPRTHVVAHNNAYIAPALEDLTLSSGLCHHCTHMVHTQTCRQNTHAHKTKTNKSFRIRHIPMARILDQFRHFGLRRKVGTDAFSSRGEGGGLGCFSAVGRLYGPRLDILRWKRHWGPARDRDGT